MPINQEYDKTFCVAGRKYNLKKLLLKSLAITESSLIPTATRFEPLYWERYMKNDPLWADKDPKVVSASYGLLQIMLPTAMGLGFTGTTEELCDPMINILLGAKFLRQLIDKSIEKRWTDKFYWLSPLQISLARWNGGGWKNPGEDGSLRNQKYVRKILKTWGELRKFEVECAPD